MVQCFTIKHMTVLQIIELAFGVRHQVHSQLAEVQSDVGQQKKQNERLEVRCRELERELESVRRSGSQPSQNTETAKEVAKYVYVFELMLLSFNMSAQKHCI